ncbi:MAG: thioredoxin family protein [Chitinophagaceae bacterium]|nr:thioredoxin family protein [Chitinophagaceae bacterium]
MRKIQLLFIASILAFGCIAQEINFEHGSFAAASAKAKKEGKLVFIDVYTSWCGPCKRMAQTVFKKEEVGTYFNQHFINFKLDAEKGEGVDIAKKYAVAIFPSFLFVDGNGNLYNRATGYRNDTTFLELARSSHQEFTTPGNLVAMKIDYPKKKKDTAFLRAYIDRLTANEINATGAIEQYLSVQTAMRPNSIAMLNFLTRYWKELCFGGRAADLLDKNIDYYRKNASKQQLALLNDSFKSVMITRTNNYAKEIRSEHFMKACLRAMDKQPASVRNLVARDAGWLDYYAGTNQWAIYQRKADRWLDSVCHYYAAHPVTKTKAITFNYRIPDDELQARRVANIITANVVIYIREFAGKPQTNAKALRWMEQAIANYDQYYLIPSIYANVLYLNKQIEAAIRWKQVSLTTLPQVSFHRELMERNLQHIQNGETLEEE